MSQQNPNEQAPISPMSPPDVPSSPSKQQPRHDKSWPGPLEKVRRAFATFVGGSGPRSGARDTDPGSG